MFIVKKETEVTVVDSIMGSGKTTWAINYMNQNIYKRFLFVTPYLSEVERIIYGTNNNFLEPIKEEGKLNSIKRLIRSNENIVCSHELIKRIDQETIDLLEMADYILLLDEVLDIGGDINIAKDDIKLLKSTIDNDSKPTISTDKNGRVSWNNPNYELGKFENIRNIALSGNLVLFEEETISKMYWIFPIEFIKAFKQVYVLTYQFEGQIMASYFKMHKLKYSKKSIRKIKDEYLLVDYVSPDKENRKTIKSLINIHHSTPRDKVDLNLIGEANNSLSKKNLENNTKKSDFVKRVKNAAYNFYFHKCKTKTENVMFTTFKDFQQKLTPRGLKSRHVSLNARATNDYANVTTCIYLVNRYMNPITKRFYTSKGIEVNEDLFALSELLQWLFRSAIRNGEPISLYIPSKRMRTLLERYLNNEI